jgi:hypothetical protein
MKQSTVTEYSPYVILAMRLGSMGLGGNVTLKGEINKTGTVGAM